MGIFFFAKSVALIEDIELEESYASAKEFEIAVDNGYYSNAYNCWIAACVYVLTLLVSGHQFYMNSRSSLDV